MQQKCDKCGRVGPEQGVNWKCYCKGRKPEKKDFRPQSVKTHDFFMEAGCVEFSAEIVKELGWMPKDDCPKQQTWIHRVSRWLSKKRRERAAKSDGSLISVIVPLSESRRWFFDRYCLPSIKSQAVETEIIVIDGDGHACTKRNKGARKAKGDFLFFLDDDTILGADCLSTLLAEIKGSDLAYCGWHGVPYRSGKPYKHMPSIWKYEHVTNGSVISTMSLIRREMFPGWDESIDRFQDYDLFWTMFENGAKGVCVREPLFTAAYIDRGISASEKSSWKWEVQNKHKVWKSEDKESIRIAITTYERAGSCLRLLKQIQRQSKGREIFVDVFDDGSESDYSEVVSFLSKHGWKYHRAFWNYGKRRWWRLFNRALGRWRLDTCAEHFYMLQDDVELCESFFDRSLDLWRSVKDSEKGSLYLLKDEARPLGGTCWTGYQSHMYGSVEKTQWVDCAAVLFSPKAIQTIDLLNPIPLRRWRKDPTTSSGVGKQLSERLNSSGIGMYRSPNSLVRHGLGASKMNPEERRSSPISGQGFDTDLVTASLATIPERRESLKLVVENLLPQVDRLCVYMNESPEVPGVTNEIPDFLIHDKITVVRSGETEFGDRGDAGKFYWAGEFPGYQIICDDDVVYPSDFVKKLIAGVDKYQGPVGFHGCKLLQPFQSYYKSRRTFHFSKEMQIGEKVDVLASNSLAYHTDNLRVSREDFPTPNMADIWFAKLCREQKKDLWTLPKREGWLHSCPNTSEDSIYSHSANGRGGRKDTGAVQTTVVKTGLFDHHRMDVADHWPENKPDVKPFDYGWLFDSTRDVLESCLNEEMEVILELGVFLGTSTRFFLEQCPHATIISADTWDAKNLMPWAEAKRPELVPVIPRIKDTFLVNLWERKDRVMPLHMNSIDAVRLVKALNIEPDLVYLDTSHRYPETLHEIQAIADAFPNARLVGDDWRLKGRRNRREVQMSVNEFVEKNKGYSIEYYGNGWTISKQALFDLIQKGQAS